MRQLIIGDIHCRKQSIDTVNEVLTKCSKLATKCDVTIFTGDVNDTKANLRSETVELLLSHFSKWPTPIIVYLGNHDYNNAMECTSHSLEFLKLVDNVTLVEKPMEIDGDFYVPYMPEDRFIEFMRNTNIAAKNIFLHQDMDWAKYNSGQLTGSVIKADLFKDFNRVFVGHIHLAQEFGNIIYVGTPYTESFKESDEQKRVIVYDKSQDKVLSVPLGVKQHTTYEYSIEKLEDLKEIKKDLKSKITKDQIVRVFIHAPEAIAPKIKRSQFKGLDIEQLKPKPIITKKELEIEESMTNAEMMEIYLSQLDIPKELCDTVKKHNSDILTEAGAA